MKALGELLRLCSAEPDVAIYSELFLCQMSFPSFGLESKLSFQRTRSPCDCIFIVVRMIRLDNYIAYFCKV